MRIIAGECGGRRLFAPPGMSTRPTADRVKEAIFSVLLPYIPGAQVLDLFAGSGALALESLSRGANSAVLVDRDPKALEVIRRNVELCGMAGRVKIKKGQAVSVLSTLETKFDLIFLDPPYNKGHVSAIEPLLLSKKVLAPGAIVVLETSTKNGETFTDWRWEQYKNSSYGDTAVLYYRLRQNL